MNIDEIYVKFIGMTFLFTFLKHFYPKQLGIHFYLQSFLESSPKPWYCQRHALPFEIKEQWKHSALSIFHQTSSLRNKLTLKCQWCVLQLYENRTCHVKKLLKMIWDLTCGTVLSEPITPFSPQNIDSVRVQSTDPGPLLRCYKITPRFPLGAVQLRQ